MKRAIAVIALSLHEARKVVRRRIQAEGRRKLALVSASEITSMARTYLLEHPEVIAQVKASPLVQELKVHERRAAGPSVHKDS